METTCYYYIDDRRWRYKIRAGLGHDCWKAFYAKPGKNYHACRQFEWRGSFGAAQADLDRYAAIKKWHKIFTDKEEEV